MTDSAFGGLLNDFLLDAQERVARVETVLLELAKADGAARQGLLTEAKRELHTLKGNAGMMGLTELQELSHRLEDQIEQCGEGEDPVALFQGIDLFRSLLARAVSGAGGANDSTEAVAQQEESGKSPTLMGSVRVPFSSLDELVDLLAEMVIFRNRLSDAVRRGRQNEAASSWDDVESSQEALGKTLNFIQDKIMRLRMVPLGSLFNNLRRIVHDESGTHGKNVRFDVAGGDTPMDKALLEVASEALGHLVRNAVIHGIELPRERQAAGKPPGGVIQLSALVQSIEVIIDVEDDGRGIDKEKLKDVAAEKGLAARDADDVVRLLFMPGVSTSDGTDLSSGRGIGLSAALESVRRLGGRIEVFSEPGVGTLFRIHLPLSVSITRSLILRADGELYAMPLSAVVESIVFEPQEGHTINHAGVLTWRERVIPVLDLGCTFETAQVMRGKGYLVIMEGDSKHRGLVVDDIVGIREIVVKALDPLIGAPQGIQGATILGDGQVILILDPPGMAAIKPFVEDGR